MAKELLRIAPEDAEELDSDTHELLRRWAARRIDVTVEQVERVLVEVTGGCGEGTCEFTTARVEVNLTDGRVLLGPEKGFGLFIRDVVEMDVAPDGSETRGWDMWELYDEDGKQVRPPTPPKPAPAPPVTPSAPAEPMVGVSIRVETDVDNGRVTGRRTEVYTAAGWVNLRQVVEAYDEAFGPLRRG